MLQTFKMTATVESDWLVVKRSDQQLRAIPEDVLEHAECVVSLDISRSHFTDLSNLSLLRKFENLTSLNLSSCGLRRLPEELFDLVKLEKLTLSGNNMAKGLSTSIRKLQALKDLDVSWCELTDLPEELWSLQKLEKVTLCYNKLEKGLSSSIGKLQELKELDVSSCKLTDLPEELWTIQQLEKLTLRQNKLAKGLSASIGKQQELKELDVSFCKLTDLPEELWSLQKIENLTLLGNKLAKGLSVSISKLKTLKELDVSLCKLTDLPEELWSLQKMEKLTLSRNEMANGLSASIGKLLELKELDLSCCELTDLPEELWSLQKLEKFTLWSNKLMNGLSALIGKLPELKELIIGDCGLTDLPEELWSLQKLEVLRLCNNRLGNYPAGSLLLPKLRILDLSNDFQALRNHLKSTFKFLLIGQNLIKELPLELKDTHLTELHLDGNPIVQPPEAIWKQGLDAIKLYLTELSSGEKKLLRVDTINMIGESEAGKSSIAQSLVKGSPVAVAAEDRTQVMQRLQANLTSSSSDSPVSINDFGGHHIYRCIIPLFLPFSGLAILAYNLKAEDSDDQEKKLKHWLLTAIAKSTKIRLVIAGTRSDKVQSSKECLQLKSKIKSFVLNVVNNLKSDVDKNISKLRSLLDKANGSSCMSLLDKRLLGLISLQIKLTEADLSFATVSCSEEFDDFHEFRQLISDKVKSPEAIPASWWQVMQEILKLNTSGFPRRTMDEVKEIYRKVIPSDPQCQNLVVILRYLAYCSQILWVENDPRLVSTIFHSPQGIVDICTKILDHRAAENQAEKRDQAAQLSSQWRPVDEDNRAPYLSPEWTKVTDIEKSRYKRGILQESLLKKSLCQYKDSEINEIVAFMEHFDLISEVKLPEVNETQDDVTRDPETTEERMFVITSNLPEEKPKELIALVDKFSNSCSSIFVSLSFVGRLVPLAFFATSLTSILAVAKKRCYGRAATRPWKNGVCITFDNILLIVECHGEEKEVTFTARSNSSKQSPWFILYPVLQRLQENISASWPGIAPEWQIMCPGCAWLKDRGFYSKQISRRLIFFKDFTSHLLEEPNGKDEQQVFEDCIHSVPRCLCHLISQDSFTEKEQYEIAQFYKSLDIETLHNDEPATNRQRTSPTDCDEGSDFSDLKRKFARARTRLVDELDSSTIENIIDELISEGEGFRLISEEACQQIQAEKTDKGKARKLHEVIQKRGDDAIKVFIKTLLSARVGRPDLATALQGDKNDP